MMAVMACAKPANAMPWQSTTVTAAYDGEQESGITIVTTGDNLAQAYYVVDGKHVTDVSHIKADGIQSITMLKGKQAKDKYGEAGKDSGKARSCSPSWSYGNLNHAVPLLLEKLIGLGYP